MYKNKFMALLLVVVIILSPILLFIDSAQAQEQNVQIQSPNTTLLANGDSTTTTGGGIVTTGSAIKNISIKLYKDITNYFYDMDKQELFYYDSSNGEKKTLNYFESYTEEGELYWCPIDYDKSSIKYLEEAQQLTIKFTPEEDKGYCLDEYQNSDFTINFVTISKAQAPLKISGFNNFLGIYGSVLLSTESKAEDFNNNSLPKITIPSFYIHDLEYALPGNWYIEDSILETPGDYYAYYNLNIPDLYDVEVSDLKEIKYPVKVINGSTIDENFIDLSYYSSKDRMGNYVFQWVWNIPDFRNVRLFESVDDGLTWQEVNGFYEDSTLAKFFDYKYSVSRNCLTLFKYRLNKDLTYQVKLKYEDKFSNILIFTFASNSSNGSIDYSVGGDRDGSDQGGPLLGPIQQPAPSNPNSPDTDNDDDNLNNQGSENDNTSEDSQEAANNNQTDESNASDNQEVNDDQADNIDNDQTTNDDQTGQGNAEGDYAVNDNQSTTSEQGLVDNTDSVNNYKDSTDGSNQSSTVVNDTTSKKVGKPANNAEKSGQKHEYVDNIITSMSGGRLKYMLEIYDKITVEKSGISVEIPKIVLGAMNILDEDIFTVSIEKYQDYGFSVHLLKNDVGITSFEPITVMFPIAASMVDKPIKVYNVNTTEALPVTINSDLNLGIVTIDTVGTYNVSIEQDKTVDTVLNTSDTFIGNNPTNQNPSMLLPSEVSATNNNWLALFIGIGAFLVLGLAGATYYFLRKKSHE